MVQDPLDAAVVVSRHLSPVPMDEIDTVERELGIVMPAGYRAFMKRYGEAFYADLFEIWAPSRVRQQLTGQRDLLRFGVENGFYEGSADTLAPSSLPAGVPIGVSADGDELLVHPTRPGELFILPRDSARIGRLAPDFSDLHSWPDGVTGLPTLQAFGNQGAADLRASLFSLDMSHLLERARARWGADGVRVTWTREDAWSWATVFFVPDVGLRFQATEDDGVTRTVIERGTRTTYLGGDRRSLWIHVSGDVEGIAEATSLLDELERDGLVEGVNRDAPAP
jgi:hypothetical protein